MFSLTDWSKNLSVLVLSSFQKFCLSSNLVVVLALQTQNVFCLSNLDPVDMIFWIEVTCIFYCEILQQQYKDKPILFSCEINVETEKES